MQQPNISGKSTGLVTTARVTHATPGAGYAHSPDRDFEATVEEISVPVIEQEKCADIAQQLVRENAYINVNVHLFSTFDFLIDLFCCHY